MLDSKYVLFFIFCFFYGCIMKKHKTVIECPNPPRHQNIPINSIWLGGCDGGYWVEILDLKNDCKSIYIKCNVYDEDSGTLEFTQNYLLKNPPKILNKITKKKLYRYSNFITEDSYVLVLLDKNGKYITLDNY